MGLTIGEQAERHREQNVGSQLYQLEDGSSLKAINWNMEEINYFDMVFKLKK